MNFSKIFISAQWMFFQNLEKGFIRTCSLEKLVSKTFINSMNIKTVWLSSEKALEEKESLYLYLCYYSLCSCKQKPFFLLPHLQNGHVILSQQKKITHIWLASLPSTRKTSVVEHINSKPRENRFMVIFWLDLGSHRR